MVLFGSTISPFVRRTAAVAAEKGMALELRQIGLGSKDPDFLKASPFVNLGPIDMTADAAKPPRTAAHVAAILARPSFATMVAQERAMLGL